MSLLQDNPRRNSGLCAFAHTAGVGSLGRGPIKIGAGARAWLGLSANSLRFQALSGPKRLLPIAVHVVIAP